MIKIIFFGNESGAQYWRFIDPSKYLLKTGDFDVRINVGDLSLEDLKWSDIIITQGAIDKLMISMFYMAQEEWGKSWIVEFDDWITVEKNSPFKLEHTYSNVPEIMSIQMKNCSMITTTTEFLAKRFRKLNKNVCILPNFLDPERWNVPILRNPENTIRIGWAGSMTHFDDFSVCSWALRKILKEYPNTELHISGDPRVADWFKRIDNIYVHTWPSMKSGLHDYTSKLASSRWDIGIAPLRDTFFNRCKSNIKPLEYGAVKVPCVASDVGPYQNFDGHVLIASNKYEWYDHLKNLIEDKEYRRTLGDQMYQYVWDNFNLEKNIGLFIEAYKSLRYNKSV